MLYGVRNPWRNKNNTLNPKKINIDMVLDKLSEFHKTEIFFDEVLNGNNLVLEVYYEDLVKDLSVDFSNDNNKPSNLCVYCDEISRILQIAKHSYFNVQLVKDCLNCSPRRT